jgi:hypothetical protein
MVFWQLIEGDNNSVIIAYKIRGVHGSEDSYCNLLGYNAV